MNWLQAQLEDGLNTGRKFVILDHQYAGTRYQSEKLWHTSKNEQYFQILRDYADAVVIEIVAHDHYADLRYHSSDNVLDLPDTETKFDFHNMFVVPGMTPNKDNMPGVAYMEIDDANVPKNLKMEFYDLNDTFKLKNIQYSDLKFRSLDLSNQFGLNEITAEALAEFRKALEAD